MRNIVIVDIDGTIQRIGNRAKHLKSEPPNYDLFHDKFEEDAAIWHTCKLIYALYLTGHNIVFVTQRPKRLFNSTGLWITSEIGINRFDLHMRADDDNREPWIVKPELITNNMHIDDILFAIDDSDEVIKAYCKLGIECIKVVDPVKVMKQRRGRGRGRGIIAPRGQW